MLLTAMLLAATLLTACGTDSTTTEVPEQSVPITLTAAVDGGITRSGATGTIDYSVLASSGYGFGVFSKIETAVTDWTDWQNEPVTYNGPTPAGNPGTVFAYPGSWIYNGGTFRYWKEHANDKAIDLFAYAPYVSSASLTASGITAIGDTTDDPTVTYTIATEPQDGVDLLWGVNGSTGLPWTGATLAATGGPVLFTFRHALAAIGIHVQAMIDKQNDKDDLTDKSEVANLLGAGGDYKLTIKKVELTGKTADDKFYEQGTLHLKNTTKNTPLWTDGTQAEKTLTVPNAQIVASMRHPGIDAVTTAAVAENNIMKDDDITGVTQEPQQLLIVPHATTGAEQLFFVIPNATAQSYQLKLYWCVSGKTTSGSYVAEDRETTIDLGTLTFVAGVKYYLNLVIGLHTVNLNVTAEDWQGESVNISELIEHGTSASESLSRRR